MVAEEGLLPACSAHSYRFHLGALLACYQACELFACSGVYMSLYRFRLGSHVPRVFCFVGELFCRLNWPRAACAHCPVSCAFSFSKLRSNGPLFHSYQQTHKGETTPAATA